MVLPHTIFDHFTFLAPYYDRLIPPGSRQKLLELLALSPRHRVLDAGGGTGRIARILREYARQVVVADISLGMLREASSKDNLFLVNSPAEYLPFAGGSFDRVVMVDVLHHVANQTQTTHELWRVLKPGGWIVIEEPDIRTFAVKLIALVEKILLMRSHFLNPRRIAGLFEFPSVNINMYAENNNTWIVIKRCK
jgi:demethylmenaquinone methyltransferase/2-methoxy-6-polyprenyl-1,4-benzoquinol methylase